MRLNPSVLDGRGDPGWGRGGRVRGYRDVREWLERAGGAGCIIEESCYSSTMARSAAAHLIRSPRSVRALASAVRQEIVDVVESAGPSTIASIAQALDRKAEAL